MNLLLISRKKCRDTFGVFAVCMTLSEHIMAQEDNVHFAGFASLVYAKTISDDKKEGAYYGLSNEGEYRDFNQLGFRMDADMKNHLSFTAQILSEGAENYDPAFDWIFATYQFKPELALSVGRIRVPVYMYSDFLDTSFAYQWIEPPKTVYNFSQTPFKSIEGIKLAYTTNIGSWNSELLFWGGKGSDHFTETGVDTDLILENALGTAWTIERDWLSLRAFYFGCDSTLDLTTSIDGNFLAQNITGVENLVTAASSGALTPNFHDAVLWERDPGQFYGLGSTLDFDSFFISGEATRIDIAGKDSNLVAPKMDSYYLMVGVRLPAQWTVSLTYGEDKDYVDNKGYKQFDAYLNPAGLLGGPTSPLGSARLIDTNEDTVIDGQDHTLYELVSGLAAAIQDEIINTQDYKSKNTTLSARWDFHNSAALKFEFLHDERTGKNVSATGDKKKPEAIRIGMDLVF